MKRFLLLLVFLSPSLAFAAGQIPEKLRFDGMEEFLMATPLEDFWTEQNPKPAALSQTSLSCWRGYVGTWEIIGYKLHLLSLKRNVVQASGDTFEEHTIEVPLKEIFGQDGPVSADWFSGVLRVTRGNVIAQVNAGYASVYEEEMYFTVDEGTIVTRRTVKNDPASITSDTDLAWREFSRISPTGGVSAVLPEEAKESENGNWLGLPELTERSAELVKNKTSFEIRGICFPGRLLFPDRKAAETTIPLETNGLKDIPSTGLAVEATCTLAQIDGHLRLIATEIIELPPGLALQRAQVPDKKTPPTSEARLAANGPATAQMAQQQ